MNLPRKKFDAALPTMAMGDIAFLLLIFFVILARASDDSHLVWRPSEEIMLEPAGQPLASVVIDQDQRIFLNGGEVTVDRLADSVEPLLGDTETGRRTVHLKVDREVEAEIFEPVIEALSQAGSDLVHILEPVEEDGPSGSS